MSDSTGPMPAPDRARGVFLDDLAHDLSTPVTAIHGATELLLAGAYGPLEVEQRALLSEVLASAREMRSFVQDIADLGALDTGRLVFASAPVDLSAMVAELRAALTETASTRAVTFTLETGIDAPSIVSDGRRLRQIFSALFGYAVKASKRGSDVRASVSVRDGRLRADVESTGIVPNGDAAALFADRRDLTPGEPKPYRGPGLGLPFIGRVVAAWGGEVRAEVVDGALRLGIDLPAPWPS